MMSDKILGKLLYFFNVRELLNLMNINKKINTFFKNTEIFKKYINIKKFLIMEIYSKLLKKTK